MIGEISKNLFGTLSEMDSQLYLDKFQELHDERELRDAILSKQTTLIQSNLNLITETIKESETRNAQLKTQTQAIQNSLDLLLTSTRTFAHMVMIKTQIQDMLTFVILLLMSFQEKQKRFLEALSLGAKGGNSPIIIPPEVLYKELNKIRVALSNQPADLPSAYKRYNITILSNSFSQVTSHEQPITY